MQVEMPVFTEEGFKNGETRVYELHIGDIIYMSTEARTPILGETIDGLKCIQIIDRWTDGYIKQLFHWIYNEWMLHFSKYKDCFNHYKLVFSKPIHFVGGNYMYIKIKEKENE